MTSWQKVWRQGAAPLLSIGQLEALEMGLRTDSPQIIQGATLSPPPLQCVQGYPVEAGDPLAFALWQGGSLATVGDVEEAWAMLMFEIDRRMGEPAACRFLLAFIDESPREEVFPVLLAEVRLSLIRRYRDTATPLLPRDVALLGWGTEAVIAALGEEWPLFAARDYALDLIAETTQGEPTDG